jgi:hypothetical protein
MQLTLGERLSLEAGDHLVRGRQKQVQAFKLRRLETPPPIVLTAARRCHDAKLRAPMGTIASVLAQ